MEIKKKKKKGQHQRQNEEMAIHWQGRGPPYAK